MNDAKRRLDLLKARASKLASDDTAAQTPEQHITDAASHLRLALIHLLAADNRRAAEMVDEIIDAIEDRRRDSMH